MILFRVVKTFVLVMALSIILLSWFFSWKRGCKDFVDWGVETDMKKMEYDGFRP